MYRGPFRRLVEIRDQTFSAVIASRFWKMETQVEPGSFFFWLPCWTFISHFAADAQGAIVCWTWHVLMLSGCVTKRKKKKFYLLTHGPLTRETISEEFMFCTTPVANPNLQMPQMGHNSTFGSWTWWTVQFSDFYILARTENTERLYI